VEPGKLVDRDGAAALSAPTKAAMLNATSGEAVKSTHASLMLPSKTIESGDPHLF
jgi:hypothetical protein